MRYVLLILFLGASPLGAAPEEPPAQDAPQAKKGETLEVERVDVPAPPAAPARPQAGEAGYFEPARVKDLLQKLWLAEFRINDLLTEVRPERWKIPDAARASFGQTLQALRAQLAALDEWRRQFDQRPDSVYLGFEIYATINAALPRLDGVARSVAQHENASLGAQFSQAGNQLFDLQQSLAPYLGLLLRNQDSALYAVQTNLAQCQRDLGAGRRPGAPAAVPMKNVLPDFKGRRRDRRAPPAAGARPAPSPTTTSRPAAPAVKEPSTPPAPGGKP